MDAEQSSPSSTKRSRIIRSLGQGLGWVFIFLVSVPIVILWFSKRLLLVLVAAPLPGLLATALLLYSMPVLPLVLQVILIVLGIVLMEALSLDLSLVNDPNVAFIRWPGRDSLESFEIRCILAFNIAIIAIGVFGSATTVLAEEGIIDFSQGHEPKTISAAGLYLWNFLDSIPLLNITETLRWAPPLEYRDPWVGSLIVLFKALIIIPLVASFKKNWRREQGEPKPTTALNPN